MVRLPPVWLTRTNLWRDRANLRTGSERLRGVAIDRRSTEGGALTRPTADVRSYPLVVPHNVWLQVRGGSVRHILMK